MCDVALWYGLNYISPRRDFLFFLPFVVSLGDDFFIFLFSAIGVLVFVMFALQYYGTEIALTDHRVIYKTGLFFVSVEELDLGEIKEETISHGLLGVLLNYGTVKLDSRFVGDVMLPAISSPYKFLKFIHKVRRAVPHSDADLGLN